MDKKDIIRYLNGLLEGGLYLTMIGIPISNAMTSIGMGVAFCAWITKKFITRSLRIPASSIYILLILFLLWNLLSLFNSDYFFTSLRGVFKVIKFLALFLLVADSINKKMLKRLILAMIVFSIFISIDGLLQHFLGYDLIRFKRIDKLDYLWRMNASFHDPNNFGGYLVMVLPIFISLLFSKNIKSKTFLILIPSVVLLSFCLMRTSSRGAWLAFVIAILILCMLRKKGTIALAFLIVLAVSLLLPGYVQNRASSMLRIEKGDSMWERVQIWKGGWAMVKAHPILGVGVNTWSRNFPIYKPQDYPDDRYAHNCYLQMAAEIGIPGALIFLFFLFALMAKSRRSLRRLETGWMRDAYIGLLSGMVGFLISSAFDTHLYSLVMATLFWLSAGLLIGYANLIGTGPFRRILLVRNDRIGDLLMNTPAIRAVRYSFPFSRITVAVRPSSLEVVKGNPDVDEIITFDERDKEKSLWGKIKFVWKLRGARYDVAIMLNPTKIFNILTFLCGITRRVGYDRKWGLLLTDKIQDTKAQAQQHEVDYNLQLVGLIGAKPDRRELVFKFTAEDEKAVDKMLKDAQISEGKFIAIHPGTSNPVKRWSQAKFAQLIDKIAQDNGANIFLIGAEDEREINSKVKESTRSSVTDLTGKMTLKQLGAFLKRCRILVSNDSGPVHIATAVGTPVVAIFAKGVQGVEPARWRPLGQDHEVIHEDLVTLSVDRVFEAVKKKL